MLRMSILTLLALVVLIVPMLTAAEVYRWTDDQGRVHFGDRPPGNRPSETVDVREPVRAVPLEGAREILDRPVRPRGAQAEGDGAYTRIAIVRPEDGAGVRANDGTVSAEVALEPALDTAAGHRVVWLLDGEEVGSGSSGRATFQGLDRGDHTLRARVIDESDQELGASDTIEFSVLRFSVPRAQQRQQRPQQFPQGGAPSAPQAPQAPQAPTPPTTPNAN